MPLKVLVPGEGLAAVGAEHHGRGTAELDEEGKTAARCCAGGQAVDRADMVLGRAAAGTGGGGGGGKKKRGWRRGEWVKQVWKRMFGWRGLRLILWKARKLLRGLGLMRGGAEAAGVLVIHYIYTVRIGWTWMVPVGLVHNPSVVPSAVPLHAERLACAVYGIVVTWL